MTTYNTLIKEHNKNKDDIVGINSQLADIAKPIVVFTFDDGYAEDSLTYSILKEFGFVGCFAPIVNDIYTSGKNSLNNYAQYEKEGFEILSHSMSHLSMKESDPLFDNGVAEYEYGESAYKLRGLGFNANGIVIPFSSAREQYYAIARNIYDFILIGGTGLNDKSTFKNKMIYRASQFTLGVEGTKSLIDQAIAGRKLLVLYDHRIGVNGMTEADFRAVLTYLKTKTDKGLCEVRNMTNAISEYFRLPLTNKVILKSTKNYLKSIVGTDWSIQESGMSGTTKSTDGGYITETVRLTIPTASAGASVSYVTTFTLPNTMKAMGEKVDISFKAWGSNSQLINLDNYIDVDFLDLSDGVILTKTFPTKLLLVSNFIIKQYSIKLFVDPGVNLDNIKKIRLKLRTNIATALTVQHFVRYSEISMIFPNKSFGSEYAI